MILNNSKADNALDPKRPILVTGASGKTGSKVISALARRRARVRALVRQKNNAVQIKSLGATETALGDFFNDDSLMAAIEGCSCVIHICPPMIPDETDLARRLTNHCLAAGIERLILYSVLHPLMQEVPHHNNKLEAERYLVNSGQSYTILQPSRYMQHLTPIWNKLMETGIHAMPFSVEAKFSIVDLNDLAEATGIVATSDGHESATYQLAGPEQLSQTNMVHILSRLTGKNIRAEAKSLEDFRKEAAISGIPAARIETMVTMNRHYDTHGLVGNPNVLQWILGRPPTTFAEFVKRDILI